MAHYLEIYFDRSTILTLFYLALDCEACHNVEPGLLGRGDLRQATGRGERGTQSTRMTRQIHAMVVVGDLNAFRGSRGRHSLTNMSISEKVTQATWLSKPLVSQTRRDYIDWLTTLQ